MSEAVGVGNRKFTIAARALRATTAIYIVTLATSAYVYRNEPTGFGVVVGHLTLMWGVATAAIVGLFGASNAVARFAGAPDA